METLEKSDTVPNVLNTSRGFDYSRSNSRRWRLLATCLTACGIFQIQVADSTPPAGPAPLKQLRYDENYAYLRDPANGSDYLDPIKFVPLNNEGDSYLTLGGEIRERYEYYQNNLWGRGPQDVIIFECLLQHANQTACFQNFPFPF